MSVVPALPITMPRLSDSMEEGVITAWLVDDGDRVEIGQGIAEIETDKATMPYEAEAAGPIRRLAKAGDTVAVGEVIAVIGDGEPDARPAVTAAPRAAATRSPRVAATRASRVNASPVARRVAAARGVDLSAVTGSGPGGR